MEVTEVMEVMEVPTDPVTVGDSKYKSVIEMPFHSLLYMPSIS